MMTKQPRVFQLVPAATQKLLMFLGVCLVCFSFSGCNSDQLRTYPVAGTVVFEDGDFPMFGDVEFYNKDKKINARGKLKRDGTFVVGTYSKDDGAVEGEHEVVIIQRTRNHLMAHIEGQIKHDHGDLVHQKYYDYRMSDLVATVKAQESNEVKLTVKRAPKKVQEDADH